MRLSASSFGLMGGCQNKLPPTQLILAAQPKGIKAMSTGEVEPVEEQATTCTTNDAPESSTHARPKANGAPEANAPPEDNATPEANHKDPDQQRLQRQSGPIHPRLASKCKLIKFSATSMHQVHLLVPVLIWLTFVGTSILCL